jgi:hypothetical protein
MWIEERSDRKYINDHTAVDIFINAQLDYTNFLVKRLGGNEYFNSKANTFGRIINKIDYATAKRFFDVNADWDDDTSINGANCYKSVSPIGYSCKVDAQVNAYSNLPTASADYLKLNYLVKANGIIYTVVKNGESYAWDEVGNSTYLFATLVNGCKYLYVGQVKDETALDNYIPSVLYTVTFNVGSGTGTLDPATLKSEPNDTILIPEFTGTAPENKVFDSWNTASDGTGVVLYPNEQFVVVNDITLYAQYKDE